jgi:hypothetical protein
MKFDYATTTTPVAFYPQCNFHFTVTENEIRKFLHKRGLTYDYVYGLLFPPTAPDDYKILASIEIIRDALSSDKVDLGVDYKKKYEELVELLEPHKIDESMEPSTTLKMILKYNK